MAVWIAHRPHGPRADRYFQTSAAVLYDVRSAIEVTAAQRIDDPVTAEVLVAAVANLPFPVQLLAELLRDARSPGETTSVVPFALWAPLEATSSITPLIANQYGALEWIGNLRQDDFVSGEVLLNLVADVDPPSESLTTGVVVTADADLMLEVDDIASVIVFSIESGSNHVRLLVSPGRIRILRRN